jgi:hypothetical protein
MHAMPGDAAVVPWDLGKVVARPASRLRHLNPLVRFCAENVDFHTF